MKKLTTLIVICLLLFSVNRANADLTLTEVDGDWSNPVGDATTAIPYVQYVNDVTLVAPNLYGNNKQDQIRWGNATEKSGLGFTGAAGGWTTLTFEIGDAFQIGQLAHFNNPIPAGSELTSADLTVAMDFTEITI